jgi:hypothetical protein
MRQRDYAIDIRPIIIPVVVVKDVPQIIFVAAIGLTIFSMICFIRWIICLQIWTTLSKIQISFSFFSKKTNDFFFVIVKRMKT